MKILKFIGRLCILFAAADFIFGNFFNIDFTGMRYSPVIAGAIGAALLSKAQKMVAKKKEEDEEANLVASNIEEE